MSPVQDVLDIMQSAVANILLFHCTLWWDG